MCSYRPSAISGPGRHVLVMGSYISEVARGSVIVAPIPPIAIVNANANGLLKKQVSEPPLC